MNDFVVGLIVGLAVAVVLSVALLSKSSAQKKAAKEEVEKYRRMLQDRMELESEGLNKLKEENAELKKYLVDQFKSDLIRFYYGNDLLGTEIGAAAKNVMGIAAGILDVVCVPLKGPLMSRGAREVARLIKAMGGNELSAYGLAHLGDYETTLFSRYSHNRMYGEMLAKGQRFEKLAEGVATSEAMRYLGQKYGVELPITEAVYNVCYKEGDDAELCKQEIAKLFQRSTRAELDD